MDRMNGKIQQGGYVVVENVTGILDNHALGRVLGDLAEIGYDAEWELLYATWFGIPQKRPRMFIIAYPSSPCQQKVFHQNTFNVEGYRTGMDDESSRLFNINNKNNRTCAVSVLGNTFGATILDRERSGNNDGVSGRMDRYKSIGNSIVPQIAYAIMKSILKIEDNK